MELLRRTFIANGWIDEAGNAGLVPATGMRAGLNDVFTGRWDAAMAAASEAIRLAGAT